MTYFLKGDPTIHTKNLLQSCKFFKLRELSYLVFWSFLKQQSYAQDNLPDLIFVNKDDKRELTLAVSPLGYLYQAPAKNAGFIFKLNV